MREEGVAETSTQGNSYTQISLDTLVPNIYTYIYIYIYNLKKKFLFQNKVAIYIF